jgi:hypothetical protein
MDPPVRLPPPLAAWAYDVEGGSMRLLQHQSGGFFSFGGSTIAW